MNRGYENFPQHKQTLLHRLNKFKDHLEVVLLQGSESQQE